MSKADPTDIRSEQLRAERTEDERKRKRLEELADLTTVMRLPEGRRFMCGLIARFGVYRTSFDNSGSVTAFNEGRRNAGLMLLHDLESSEELFSLWEQAQRERRKA